MQAVFEQSSSTGDGNKKCPFCAETIQAAAIKCRYCGEFLTERPPLSPAPAKTKWYHSTSVLVLAIVTLGPLALPMVWTNPRYSLLNKAIITGGVLLLTVLLCYASALTYRNLIEQFNALGL